MLITIKTAVTFRLPKEKELMENFARDNSDWHCEKANTIGATFKRTQMFEVGADMRGEQNEL